MPAGWLGSAKALLSSGSALAPGSVAQGSGIKSLPSLQGTLSSLAGTVLENTQPIRPLKSHPSLPPKMTVLCNLRELGCRRNSWKGLHLSPPRQPIPFFSLHEPIPFFFLFPIPAVFGKTCKQLTFYE